MDHHIKGNEAIKRGDYKTAWEEYTNAISKTPKDPILWCNRAQACLKGGWPELSLLDAKRAEKLSLNVKNDPTRQTILFKAKYRYAEALSALGIPKLAGFAYDEFINELRDGLIDDLDRKIYEEKRDGHLRLINKQINVLDELGAKEKMVITDEGSGWYKFFGKYPWDDRVEERLDTRVLQKFQRELDIASNGKLQVALFDPIKNETDFNFMDQMDLKGFESKFEIGIIAKQDLPIKQIIFEDDPFLTVHKRYELRCDYCVHLLLEPSDESGIKQSSEYPKKFPCPNSQCKESFCNVKCYLLAKNLYHKQLCGKNIEKIIEFVQTDAHGINLLALFALKVFAVAKMMDICPLDIEEIKYLHRHQSIQDFQDGYDVWVSRLEEIYMEILNILDISLYNIKYDFWIFITVLNILEPNIFEGPSREVDEEETDTAALFPLASLINHSCNPNSSHFEILSDIWINYGHVDKIREIRSWIKCNYKNHHSFRIFIGNDKPIKKGEQVFISYCDEDDDKETRQTILLETYGFKCRCFKCESEQKAYKQKPIAWHLYFPKYIN